LSERLSESEIYCVSQGLLGAWLCVPVSMSEDAALAGIIEKLHGSICEPPTWNPELIRDRLYGGFGCSESDRRHVYFSEGQYTFLGENGPLDASERANQWQVLIEKNCDGAGHRGDGPFTSDAPSTQEDAR